jgi:PilZ domain
VEQRRTRRFTLQLPVSVTRAGAERVTQAGLTKNISSGGVLFTSAKEPDVGVSIEYVISLMGPRDQTVSLRCIGKVVRAKRLSNSDQPSFDVAATLERYEFVRSEN